jgi:hypothetical protein
MITGVRVADDDGNTIGMENKTRRERVGATLADGVPVGLRVPVLLRVRDRDGGCDRDLVAVALRDADGTTLRDAVRVGGHGCAEGKGSTPTGTLSLVPVLMPTATSGTTPSRPLSRRIEGSCRALRLLITTPKYTLLKSLA